MAQRTSKNHSTRNSKHLKQIMNPKEAMPVLARLAPVIATAGPPALIAVGAGLFLWWLLSDSKREEAAQTPKSSPEVPSSPQNPVPAPVLTALPSPQSSARVSKRIRREDVAEALAYGARSMTRQEAVVALQALGFGKTATYKALSANSRFAEFIEIAPDGLIEWKG